MNQNLSKGLNSGKVVGKRKLSSQSRGTGGKNTSKHSVQKNSWMAPPNQGFSNIINNNISGLSINYSN